MFREIEFIYTYREIYMCVEAYFEHEQMNVLQNYENLVSIAKAVFGSDKKKKPDNVYNPSTPEELMAQMRRSMNGGKR